MSAKLTVRHRLKRRAVLSRTSLRPRRNRREASRKPAGDRIEMMARLNVVAASDQYRMPAHHPPIMARRHQKHAGDRQEYGQPSALMALLASVHTLETVSQIVIANFAENGNDLLLNAKTQFHFALCCHARIYAARSSDPGFSGKCGWSSWRWGCCAGLEHPRGLLQRFVSRVSTTFDN
jgi:hypothetical protein